MTTLHAVPESLRARYDDIQFLGEGGMGIVYRAIDPRLNRIVALKLLKSTDTEQRKRFLVEARSQARISHEHVCRIYETGEVDGEPYIAMQFIQGEPLSHLRKRLSFEQCVYVMIDVALAVHEAHRKGVIHRDLKPANILVETRDDGTLEPWVVDFGLAREVHAQGQTKSGVVLGTIEYMPPEQAYGDIRALDRRADVYALGATLYDLVAGRTPFVDEQPWKLLLMVGDDDAPKLSTWCKEVPRDLETIVMKCLEREPGRRYDSARALAEDLQRFLDGEPIHAERAGLAYIVLKRARKHRGVVALTSTTLLLLILLVGVWRKGKAELVEQAKLAQELGQDVTEMELFLRNAYTMPKHDVERERDLIHKQLDAIGRRMAAMGDVGAAPGDYALGRGYLALDEPEQARVHLVRARAAGYTSPELDYGLGRALGELYRKGLNDAKRVLDPKDRQARIAKAETQYRDPALIHLRAALAAQIEVPAYAEGLIAYYEGHFESALEKAKLAFSQAPWLYEAKKLEADSLFAEGSKHRSDTNFDYEKMMFYFEPAARAYSEAAEFARSNPDVHRAECELWLFVTYAHMDLAKDSSSALEHANTACRRAIETSSKDVQSRILLASVTSVVANYEARAVVLGPNTAQRIADAIRDAEDARRAAPEDATANYVAGVAYSSELMFRRYQGREGSRSLERATAAYEAAIRLDSKSLWAHTERLGLCAFHLAVDSWRGTDPAVHIADAEQVARRALAVDPDFPFLWIAKGQFYVVAAQSLLDMGQSPKQHVDTAIAAAEEFRRRLPILGLDYGIIMEAHLVEAEYQTLIGTDPEPTLQAAKTALKAAQAGGLSETQILEKAGEMHLITARFALDAHHDPTASVEAARTVFRQAMRQMPWRATVRAALVRTEIVAIRWAMARKNANTSMFDAALVHLPASELDAIVDPGMHVAMAEVYALRAIWLAESNRDPANDVARGIERCDKVLEINPHHGLAFAIKGQLLLVQARRALPGRSQSELATAAKDAFEHAFKTNVLLKREYGSVLAAAAKLLP